MPDGSGSSIEAVEFSPERKQRVTDRVTGSSIAPRARGLPGTRAPGALGIRKKDPAGNCRVTLRRAQRGMHVLFSVATTLSHRF